MKNILNLTQHYATEEQINDGVIEPTPADKALIKTLLTFNSIPTMESIENRAIDLANIALCYSVDEVMIGGAPYLMGCLEDCLYARCMRPVYSFTERVSEEKVNPDGTVVKTSVFKHVGFVR